IHHVHLSPHPATAALSTAPVTEILVRYFPTSLSDSDKKAVEDNLSQFSSKSGLTPGEAGFYGASSGWVLEEVANDKSEGGKGTAHLALLGWQSVDAHEQFRQTQGFKDNISLIREAPKMQGMEVQHVAFTQLTSTAGGVGAGAGAGAGTSTGAQLEGAQEEVLNPHQDLGVGKNSSKGGAGAGGLGSGSGVKSQSDGSTTKNNDALKGAGNSTGKERSGRSHVD
ncbi:hypothetical protein LTS18_004811, partial [Coniosporium uncinatum]